MTHDGKAREWRRVPGLYVLDGKTPRRVHDVMEWRRQFVVDNRHVADTRIGKVRISTVFLGLDHSFSDGPPLLFETMVFDGLHDGWQQRYSTFEEAEAGHAAMVEVVKADESIHGRPR